MQIQTNFHIPMELVGIRTLLALVGFSIFNNDTGDVLETDSELIEKLRTDRVVVFLVVQWQYVVAFKKDGDMIGKFVAGSDREEFESWESFEEWLAEFLL